MKIFSAQIISLFAAILLFAPGCGERPDPNAVHDFNTIPDSFVLAIVDGSKITARDARARLDIEKKFVTIRRGDSTPPKQLEAELDRLHARRAPMMVAELANQKLLRSYFRKNGLELPHQTAESAVSLLLAKFRSKKPFADFAAENGMDPGYLREQLLVPEIQTLCRTHFNGGPVEVTEKEIDEGLARQTRYYNDAVASNALAYAACSNVLKLVKAPNADFAAIAREHGTWMPEEAVRWERMEWAEIEEKDLRDWAFSNPVGSVGGPFELEDGLAIVKILEKTEGTLQDSAASAGVADVTLARITWRMIVPEPEPRTREYVRSALTRWKTDRLQKAFFAKLHSEMEIEYPNGTNFNFKTTRERK